MEWQARAEGYSGKFGVVASGCQPGEPFDLAIAGWLADYPDPRQILNWLLDGTAGTPAFNDPAYQRRLAAAARLSGPQRYLTYGALDLDLARNAAPLAAFANPSSNDFFSARIGCQTYGVYGMDLAALCLNRPDHRGSAATPVFSRCNPGGQSAPIQASTAVAVSIRGAG